MSRITTDRCVITTQFIIAAGNSPDLVPTKRRGFTIWKHLSLSFGDRREMMANPASNSEDPAAYEDRRAYPRVPVAMPAFLQAEGKRHAVQVVDLSVGGAKLSCSASLSTGTAVVLDCGTLGRSAVVRWQTGGMLGICFDSELDAREVTALIARSIALDSLMKTRG